MPILNLLQHPTIDTNKMKVRIRQSNFAMQKRILDYEPQRKRRHFLSKLEDQGMAQDELDTYLNTRFSPQEGR